MGLDPRKEMEGPPPPTPPLHPRAACPLLPCCQDHALTSLVLRFLPLRHDFSPLDRCLEVEALSKSLGKYQGPHD